ncbi:hypothetical protein NDU88_001291 [Pleurodeles waltl]|uniref:Uncharacterized protein n=1 Tax=Pleurodeles waltl TaxID=8319 RepID=A0AAV7V979_PLEWA|nr:hypothetical protein NDU88_001291 [Pleurodeles waltl]
MQGDTFFSLSDHSSWSSNEQLDSEADKASSELDSEVSSLAPGRESHGSSKNATVRKKQKKRSKQVGPNKHSTNSLDTKGLQGLQWEYSKDDLTLYDNVEKQPNPVSLETIYQSIMEHREESKSESRKTQLACRMMQIQIRRVVKTCSEFATRMEEVETRVSHLEDEAGSHQVTRAAMEKQLEDTHRYIFPDREADGVSRRKSEGVHAALGRREPHGPGSWESGAATSIEVCVKQGGGRGSSVLAAPNAEESGPGEGEEMGHLRGCGAACTGRRIGGGVEVGLRGMSGDLENGREEGSARQAMTAGEKTVKREEGKPQGPQYGGHRN